MRIALFAICLLSLASCSGTRFFRKQLKSEIEASPVFSQAFTGFQVVDAASGRALCSVNADRYFTPASNTKILTLATCLKVLGDSLPGLKIVGKLLGGDEIRGGTEWVQAWLVAPTGDPTFLHPKFQAWQPVFHYLKTTPVVYVTDPGRIAFDRFGPGWSWDDYAEDYSAERSAFPIYGNVCRARWQYDHWDVLPERYADSIHVSAEWDRRSGKGLLLRREFSNQIDALGVKTEDLFDYQPEIPIYNTEKQNWLLLSDTLGWQASPLEPYFNEHISTIYSTPVDTVYRRMMYESDNFVAEQLLLVCAGEKFDTLNPERMIAWAKDSLFGNYPDPPRWVDGSGLSRYNLISPHFLTTLLRQLYLEQPRERLFSLFPAGGASGTIANWYRGPDGKPFVFAKTGSMSGVHCLSGYLVAKSGKVLIFSFMHNNFIGKNKPWKEEMQRLLLEMWAKG